MRVRCRDLMPPLTSSFIVVQLPTAVSKTAQPPFLLRVSTDTWRTLFSAASSQPQAQDGVRAARGGFDQSLPSIALAAPSSVTNMVCGREYITAQIASALRAPAATAIIAQSA